MKKETAKIANVFKSAEVWSSAGKKTAAIYVARKAYVAKSNHSTQLPTAAPTTALRTVC